MRQIAVLAFAFVQFGAPLINCAQTNPHKIAVEPSSVGSAVSLELRGNAPAQFSAYYDTYVVEVSNDLSNWSLLATLVRVNSSSERLVWVDSQSIEHGARFYRTPTNHLISPFLKPTGPYLVGTTSVLLTDPMRTSRYNLSGNGSFMVTLWYPGQWQPGARPQLYVEPKLTQSLGGLYEVSASLLGAFRSFALGATSIATNGAPFPVVIYCHGFKVSRRDNSARCEELASHGFVVVAIDHSDCLATVFPDGRLLNTTVTGLSLSLFENNVKDVRFVLDWLGRLNEVDPMFRNSMDLQRVGTMGWSYGGGVAAEICRTDARVLATVLLEAYLQNAHDVAWLGIPKPVLAMYNATSAFTTPFDQATHDAYWTRIAGTEHQHFADWRAWISSPTEEGRQAAIAMNGCVLSFFNKYLKNHDDHLLDDPGSVYSEIVDFVKK